VGIFQQSAAIFGHTSSEMKTPLTPMIPIFLPASSKIKLLALCFGSLLVLGGGLKAGHIGGNLQRRLLVPTGLAGLLYVLLELCWYSISRFSSPVESLSRIILDFASGAG
jgi:hypothetical protein